MKKVIGGLLVLTLGGCSMVPEYHRPPMAVPKTLASADYAKADGLKDETPVDAIQVLGGAWSGSIH